MAAYGSNYLEAAILDQMLRGVAYVWPTTLYAALLTDSNTATQRRAGTVTEVPTATWSNYARTAVVCDTATFAAAAGDPRSSVNSGAAIAFGTATSSGNVTCTALALYDAATAGDILLVLDLTTPVTVATGNVVTIPVSSLTISLT